jgi:hypothetical protein
MRTDTFYRPVIRWKQGEQGALAALSRFARRALTPIIEPVRSCYGSRNGELKDASDITDRVIAEQIKNVWGSYPFFIDCRSLPYWVNNRSSKCSTAGICDSTSALGLNPIPVLGRNDERTYREIGASNSSRARGICLRLDLVDLALPGIADELTRIFKIVGLSRRRTDLIVDYGAWYEGHPRLADLLERVVGAERWRSVTVLSGSFPAGLAEIPEGFHSLRRKEWHWWLEQVSEPAISKETISFGDYTTQHGVFTEPPEGCNPSVSVRYATEDAWLVCRGQGIKQGGADQWTGHARMLAEHPDVKRHGPDFSAGTRYVFEHCDENIGTGNFSTWLQAGVNQHLELVAHQVAQLVRTVVGATNRRAAPIVTMPLAARSPREEP